MKALISKLQGLQKNGMYNALAQNAFWSLVNSVFNQLGMVVSSIVTAKILGQDAFGELGIVRSTVNMFYIFAGAGLGVTCTKFVAEFDGRDKDKVSKVIGSNLFLSLGLGLVFMVVLFFLAGNISQHVYHNLSLTVPIQISGLILFLNCLIGVQNGALTGFKQFKDLARISIWSAIVYVPAQIGLAYYYGVNGAVFAIFLQYIVQYTMNEIELRKTYRSRELHVKLRMHKSEIRTILRFALPNSLSGLLVTPVIWLSNTMLANTLNGFKEVAIFSAANQIRMVVLFVPSAVSKIVLPYLSSNLDNEHLYKKVFRTNILFNFFVAFALAAVLMCGSSMIMKIYGPEYSVGTWTLNVLLICTILIAINNVVGQALVSTNNTMLGFGLNLMWAIVFITSAYFLLEKLHSSLALAYAYLISYSTHTILQFWMVKKVKKKELA